MMSQSLLKNKDMKEMETVFIGIDVSKLVLDVCILDEGGVFHRQIKNTLKDIQSFFNKLIRANKSRRIAVCMENTGYYNWPCYEVFKKMPLDVYVINPLHLKRSLGMVRGKNDVIDAHRIARFIALHSSELKVTKIARTEIRQLQALLAQRNRLIEVKTKLSVPVKELSFMADKNLIKQVSEGNKEIIKGLDRQIKGIEKQMDALVSADQELCEIYKYATSVQGVGKVLAWTLLIKTNEFKSINDPRKLACYAGVVPFEYQSGSSIYKKPKVSYMADKTLKKLLHLSAMRAIQLKGELQAYYQRKVAEGKNKMLVLNAVRNKIVARICAMVNNKKLYQINLHLS